MSPNTGNTLKKSQVVFEPKAVLFQGTATFSIYRYLTRWPVFLMPNRAQHTVSNPVTFSVAMVTQKSFVPASLILLLMQSLAPCLSPFLIATIHFAAAHISCFYISLPRHLILWSSPDPCCQDAKVLCSRPIYSL